MPWLSVTEDTISDPRCVGLRAVRSPELAGQTYIIRSLTPASHGHIPFAQGSIVDP